MIAPEPGHLVGMAIGNFHNCVSVWWVSIVTPLLGNI